MIEEFWIPIISVDSIALISITGIIINYLIFIKNRKDKYILSLIDRKLEVLQKAYTYSNRFINLFHADEETKFDFISEITKWYNDNCLFLKLKIRNMFKLTIKKLSEYKDELNRYYELRKNNEKKEIIGEQYDKLLENFKDINTLPDKIEEIIYSDFYN